MTDKEIKNMLKKASGITDMRGLLKIFALPIIDSAACGFKNYID